MRAATGERAPNRRVDATTSLTVASARITSPLDRLKPWTTP